MKYPIQKLQVKPSNLVARLLSSLEWADKECPAMDEEPTTHFERMTAFLREHNQLSKLIFHEADPSMPGGTLHWVKGGVVFGGVPTYEFFKRVISEEVKEGRIDKSWLNSARWNRRVFPSEATYKALVEACFQAHEEAVLTWVRTDLQ